MTTCLSTESFGDVRITGGGDSGRLEFWSSSSRWGTVCRNGFNDDAADVACRQLDYVQSDDVYTYSGKYVDIYFIVYSLLCNRDAVLVCDIWHVMIHDMIWHS